jgi:ATP-dependent protease Clp ATPase subunit
MYDIPSQDEITHCLITGAVVRGETIPILTKTTELKKSA